MTPLRRQRGLGLVTAIALIVVVATLLAALLNTLRSSAELDSLDYTATRTLLAAESAMDLALNRVYAPRGTPSCAARNYSFGDGGLRGCSATVTCTSRNVGGRAYMDLSARASCGSAPIIASRQIDSRVIAP